MKCLHGLLNWLRFLTAWAGDQCHLQNQTWLTLYVISGVPGVIAENFCIHKKKLKTTKTKRDEYLFHSKRDLMNLLRLLFLRRGCVHVRIANELSKPGVFKFCAETIRCRACLVCVQNWGELFLPVRYGVLCVTLVAISMDNNYSRCIKLVVDRLWRDKARSPEYNTTMYQVCFCSAWHVK